jgi:menaquinone-dependent protoporphyrinogen oxidase
MTAAAIDSSSLRAASRSGSIFMPTTHRTGEETHMASKVLVAFATGTGTTREVAEAIGAELTAAGHTVEVKNVSETKDIDDYDAVVAGTPVMMGMINGRFKRFVRRNARRLATKKVVWFLVCGFMNDPTEENVRNARKRLDAIQKLAGNVPAVDTAMFGGAVKTEGADFRRMNPILKSIARKVAADLEDGRDWDAIKAWARGVGGKL